MEYRRLGNSGLQLSLLSYGSWVTFSNQCNENSAIELMGIAYDKGVNFFDNAEVYASGKSEEIMGSALKKLGWSRDSFCVSSKVFWGGDRPNQRGLSRKHVHDACHAALKRLQLDYLDLFFCHRPDLHTPIEETVRVMNDLITQGKILYWGTSEWTAAQIMEAHAISRQFGLIPPSMEQPEYNIFHRKKMELEYLDLFERKGLGTTSWSPLASGLLTAKYNNGMPEGSRVHLAGYEWLKKTFESEEGQRKISVCKELNDLALELSTSLTKLSIAWCAKNKNVSTVILGASKASQLKENLESLELISKLSPEIMDKIDEIAGTRPPKPFDWRKV